MFCIKEGFYAETVSCEDQPVLSAVPDGNGKHPSELVDKIESDFFIEVGDALGIRVG